MKRSQSQQRRRAGFTLIEMMVVMSIIAVLSGLLAAGLGAALRLSRKTSNRHEISQLNTALGNFVQTYKLSKHPPSRLKLCSLLSQYGTSQLDIDSKAYLLSMFPGIDVAGGTWSGGALGTGAGILWDRGVAALPVAGVVLEGDQCLVFFLGGIPGTGNQCLGFSTDTTNPASLGGERRLFYELRMDRLVKLHADGVFYSYKDYYETRPFLYFSSYGTNGYNRYDSAGLLVGSAGAGAATSDCATFAVSPKTSGATVYLNRGTCQIISAGADLVFGTADDQDNIN